MLSSVRAISRRALTVAGAGVLALSTLPAVAADSLEELLELNARAWSGEPELLAEAYAPDGVHSATFYDRTNVYEGPDEIAGVAGYGVPESVAPRIDIPAADGEYRWADFLSLAGGSACLWRAVDGQITRQDCLLPEKSYDSRMPAGPADADASAAIDELSERLGPTWGSGSSVEALAEVYAPDAVHTARFLNDTKRYVGPTEIARVALMGPGGIGQIGPRVDFEAPEGELAWAQVSSVAGGTVCLFRAVDGMITRHDCVLPIAG